MRRRPGRFDEEGRAFPVVVRVEGLGADDGAGPTRAVMRIGNEEGAGVLGRDSSPLLERCFCHLAK